MLVATLDGTVAWHAVRMLAPALSALVQVRRRLIPLLFVLYVVAYLDRVNVSFAASEMGADLGLTAAAYGLGAGIFFIGYFLFEVPSNLLLRRFGARRWIARILVSWGILAGLMAFVSNEWQFYLVRFLLGIAEAGFFPGVVLYLTFWVPRAERARTLALFLTATAVAGLVGAPLSGLLLSMDGFLGLQGWQWLFIVEAVPAVVMGFVVWRHLPDGPREARWLTGEQREALDAVIAADAEPGLERLSAAFTSGRVWLLAALYLAIVIGFYGISLWLPLIVKRDFAGLSPLGLGLVTAIPYLCAVVAMVMVGRSSDRTRERTAHLVIPLLAGAVGLALAGLAGGGVALAAICLATAGIYAALGPFWTLPPAFLRGAAAAAGIAWINSVGNLGGFIGPYSVGRLADTSGGLGLGLLVMAAIVLIAAVLGFGIATALTRRHAP